MSTRAQRVPCSSATRSSARKTGGQAGAAAVQGECRVCGRLTRAYFYKLYVCCACTMFYRRNFRSFPRASCRFHDGNCNLKKGPRRFCLHCRLRACRGLGLRMWGKNLVVQANGMPADDIAEESMDAALLEGAPEAFQPSPSTDWAACSPADCVLSPASSASSSACSSSSSAESSSSGYSSASGIQSLGAAFEDVNFGCTPTCTPCTASCPSSCACPDDLLAFTRLIPVELPALRSVVGLFKQFDEQQKFLASLQHKRELFDHRCPLSELVHMDGVQFDELEGRCRAAAAQLLAQHLDPVLDVPDEGKVALIRAVLFDFSALHKLLNTVRQFPALAGQKLASFFAGYVTDLGDVDGFLADLDEEDSDLINATHSLFRDLAGLAERARLLQLHPVEAAFLLFYGLVQKAEQLHIFSNSLRHALDVLSSEFGYFLEQDGGQARLDRLLEFREQLSALDHAHADSLEQLHARLADLQEGTVCWMGAAEVRRCVQALRIL